MGELLATVSIASDTGFAEDAVVNSFAFKVDGPNESNTTAVLGELDAFYNDPVGGGNPLCYYMSPNLQGTSPVACTVKFFDLAGHLDGSPHGAPIGVTGFGLGARATDELGLPEEVALCLTMRANNWEQQAVEEPDSNDPGTEPDRPLQRHTGRLYLGPFNAAALDDDAGASRPIAALRTAVLDAGQRLADELIAIGGNWAVWSRADAFLGDISDLFVDNAWDTQRRRGASPTVRTTRNIF